MINRRSFIKSTATIGGIDALAIVDNRQTGCIKGVNPPANFDYAAPFTEMALLGMVAICRSWVALKPTSTFTHSTITIRNSCRQQSKFNDKKIKIPRVYYLGIFCFYA